VRKHRLKVILYPIAVFFWLIGWGLFFLGSEERNKPRKTMGDAKKEIEIGIAMPMLKEVRPNS